MGHYLENIGDEPLVFLEAFKSSQFADFSANQWLALSPHDMVKAHLNVDDETIAALSKTKPLVV
ncbi:hypothetical protein RAA17_24520 [Komagataeibacter rhaeticus]|nr:hypothetical protein [Komagataeibacter rhaeticus]